MHIFPVSHSKVKKIAQILKILRRFSKNLRSRETSRPQLLEALSTCLSHHFIVATQDGFLLLKTLLKETLSSPGQYLSAAWVLGPTNVKSLCLVMRGWLLAAISHNIHRRTELNVFTHGLQWEPWCFWPLHTQCRCKNSQPQTGQGVCQQNTRGSELIYCLCGLWGNKLSSQL